MGPSPAHEFRFRLVRTASRHHPDVSSRAPGVTVKPQTGHILATEYRLWASQGVTLFAPHTCKLFTSVQAFDGYVQHLSRAGYLVTFSNPFSATVARPLL